jgi:DNA-directed RNA polymerase specialized sigma24 family protein
VEEMNLDEIAEATGLSAGTVKSHLHRALTAVRKAEGGTR